MPKVSIIVPNYNHAKYLTQRLDSILNQTYTDFEVILLDDFSTDNSSEIINKYFKNPKIIHIILNVKNTGSTFEQWIKGIELSRGEFIWIAESDDFAEKNFLEIAINRLKNNCSLFFSQSYITKDHGAIQGRWNENLNIYNKDFSINGKELIQKYMTTSNIIPNASAVVFKRELLDDIIKKNIVTYKINGDWYLWINLLLKGDCVFCSEPLNYFRRHKDAGSPKNVTNFKNIEEAFKINIFLKNKGFKISGKNWIGNWVSQTGYSFKVLFERNFWNIYKLSFNLYQFPFAYLSYIIVIHKMSRFKDIFKFL